MPSSQVEHSPATRAAVRAVVAGVALAFVWGLAFATEVLPFFLTVPAGGALTGLAGVWVRRGSRGWHQGEDERRRFPPFAVDVRHVRLALVVAVGHFGIGHALFALGGLILPGLTETAGEVYARASSVPVVLGILLGGLITAPLEEIFWRGAVQPLITSRIGDAGGPLARLPYGNVLGMTLVYTIFHVATGQLALIAAAVLGGLIWGWLLERTGSVGATMIAHGTWTTLMLLVPPV